MKLLKTPKVSDKTLLEALEEFSQAEDISGNNLPLHHISEHGYGTWSFRRGNFQPDPQKNNPISAALREYEYGEELNYELVRDEIYEALDIEFDLLLDKNPPKTISSRMITHIILKSRRNITDMLRSLT